MALVNQPAFERWLSQHFPEAQLQDGVESSRTQSVAQFRNTKVLRCNLPELVCLRSTRDGVLLRDGASVETTRATMEHGAFVFTLSDPTPYALIRECALIENLAVFHSYERLGLAVELAIWTAGISSTRFIGWLAANVNHGLRVLHLPDYDPVGLTEFLRHHERLGEAVSLFLPDELPALFRWHSNPLLLGDPKNQRMLMKLREARHPDVRRVVALIEENNGGLEQEAIFIAGASATI